jgi:hypothetical protein
MTNLNQAKESGNNFKKAYLLLLPVGVLLSYISSLYPLQTERYYSTRIDRIIISGLSRGSGILPFSLGEAFLLLFLLFLLWKLVKILVILLGTKKYRQSYTRRYLINGLAFVSIIYLAFILLWGVNYNRLSFARIANLDVQPATTEELAEVCGILIDRTNELRLQIDVDEDGVMQAASGKAGILQRAGAGYEKAAAIHPELGGTYGQPKGIWLSEPMSYLGLTGVYCPFTGEANVNMAVPDALLPAVASHEMAHQRGFAREDEANYIAYLTCTLNPDPDFRYSGNLLAVIIAMNMLETYDPERYLQLQAKYSDGVKQDLNFYSLFWKEHASPAGELSDAANDLYLKSNRQYDGVYSYNRMVDLLIAEFKIIKGQTPGY